MTTKIFTSDYQAIRQAKLIYSNILGISKDSVHVGHDKYHESCNSSTTCVCGETRCIYLKMTNAGTKQQQKLQAAIDRPGAVLMFGICESCGSKF